MASDAGGGREGEGVCAVLASVGAGEEGSTAEKEEETDGAAADEEVGGVEDEVILWEVMGGEGWVGEACINSGGLVAEDVHGHNGAERVRDDVHAAPF